MRSAFFALMLVAPLASHAVVATRSYTSPGTADAAWTYVGAMGGGSAVAVGAYAVLTAGHVAASDFVLGGKTYRMAGTAAGPLVGGRTTDLRVVRLQDALPGWYDVATSVRVGSTLTMVGLGGTGVLRTDNTGYRLEDGGVRRAGANVLTSKTTVAGRGPALRSLLDGAGESALASGDSGGGWFVGGKLVGISSFVYSNDARRPAYGFAGRAYFGSGAIDLTNRTIRAWVTAQATPPPGRFASPQAVPEPGTLLIIGLGALGVLRWRR